MTSTYGKSLEQTLPVVQELGLNTTKNIDFDSGSNSCALPASTTIGGSAVVALASITSNATTGAVFSVTATGVYTGVGVTQFISDSATTGVSVLMTANGLTTGTVLSMTSTGTIVTTGEMLNIVADSATTSTGLVRISGAGLTDGFAMQITAGGANQTSSGGGINLLTGAATVGTGLAITNTSGIYVGTTGLLAVTANSATTGSIVVVTANGLTTGHGLSLASSGVIATTGDLLSVIASGATTSTGVVRVTTAALTTGSAVTVTANALTSGTALTVSSSSTDTTAHGLVTLANSGTGSIASLIKGTNAAISTHFFKFATVNSVTIWIGDGNTGNGALSGTAGDVLFNGGSNKPEYCTGTTSWTALV